ncbi:hypothetical protein [Paenibacillus alkalitolerans]|uniref:hypothetical protein n=1 Tax=Paenibacillus alkalitolerans TaxID=2799335 RepID=UPI0018F2948D|nr:hypothetical protein [Paenibacillus alkalitolerans]
MALPFMRTIPFEHWTLEDVSMQYVPTVQQLLITFYVNGYQFALICIMIDDQFQPVKLINNLKKDNDDLRCKLTLTLLCDYYKEIFQKISDANPSFHSLIEKELHYWNRKR